MKTLIAVLLLCLSSLATSIASAACPEGTQLYMRGWYIGTTPNQYTHAQLWNASRPIYVQRVVVGLEPAQAVAVMLNSVPIDHPLEVSGAGSANGLAGDGSFSTSAHLRYAVSGAVLGGQLMNIQQGSIEMNGFTLPPGKGILIRPGLTNSPMRITFVWCE